MTKYDDSENIKGELKTISDYVILFIAVIVCITAAVTVSVCLLTDC